MYAFAPTRAARRLTLRPAHLQLDREIAMNTGTPLQHRARNAAFGLAGLLALGACASTPPPTAALQAARVAISTAEQADAGHYAPGELSEARARLESAQSAVGEQKMIIAEHYAKESSAEATLAASMTAEAKAKAVNADMRQSTATLIQEMQRASGEQL
jgi:Domain of unknown function (DUF4398)